MPANVSSRPFQRLTETDLKIIAEKRVYFGHQSVGANIMEGVEEIAKENPDAGLHVVETKSAKALENPALAHGRVGQNEDPRSKIHDFDQIIRSGIGEKAEIAFFKLCYIDIDRETDTRSLFGEYKSTMNKLAEDYPAVEFIHVTVPIRMASNNWKTQVKKLIGRPNLNLEDNLRRQEFNELMRKEYAERSPFFDLAAAEATFEDGKMLYRTKGEATVPCLVPEYTNDGGHLNERGRKIVAERLLTFLASLDFLQK